MNIDVAVANRRGSNLSERVASAAGVSPDSPPASYPILARSNCQKFEARPQSIVIRLHHATQALITRDRRYRSDSQAKAQTGLRLHRKSEKLIP